MQIPESFGLVAELAGVLGVKKINTLPGLWRQNVDDDWAIAANGHPEEIEGVPPYSVQIINRKYIGGGVVNARGGMMIGGQEAEDDFIAATRAAIAHAAKESPR